MLCALAFLFALGILRASRGPPHTGFDWERPLEVSGVAARLVAERRASTRPLPGHCAGGHAKSVDATDSQVVPPHRSLMRLHPERLLNLAAPLLVTLAISFFCFHELGFSWRWSIPAGLFTAVRMQKRGFI